MSGHNFNGSDFVLRQPENKPFNATEYWTSSVIFVFVEVHHLFLLETFSDRYLYVASAEVNFFVFYHLMTSRFVTNNGLVFFLLS